MPSLNALNLVGNPSLEPLTYPGPLVEQTCLLVSSWIYPIIAELGSQVGDWRVKPDGGPLQLSTAVCLDEALALSYAAPMAARQPVLAIGSNASPGQLLHKFGGDAVIPLTRVGVRGCIAGHSPHVSVPGYIPYVALAAADVRRTLVVAWLDLDEQHTMDRTEPNYTRVVIDGDKVPAVLESGDRLTSYALYRGRWGALRLSPMDPPLAATGQDTVLVALAKQSWFRRMLPDSATDPATLAAALAADPELRNLARAELARHGLAAEDGFDPNT